MGTCMKERIVLKQQESLEVTKPSIWISLPTSAWGQGFYSIGAYPWFMGEIGCCKVGLIANGMDDN